MATKRAFSSEQGWTRAIAQPTGLYAQGLSCCVGIIPQLDQIKDNPALFNYLLVNLLNIIFEEDCAILPIITCVAIKCDQPFSRQELEQLQPGFFLEPHGRSFVKVDTQDDLYHSLCLYSQSSYNHIENRYQLVAWQLQTQPSAITPIPHRYLN